LTHTILLAIATDIPVPLVTGFVVKDHTCVSREQRKKKGLA